MFTMTKAEALKIQTEQIAWYSKYCVNLAEKVAALTTADALQDGVEYPVSVVNKHIQLLDADIEHILRSVAK